MKKVQTDRNETSDMTPLTKQDDILEAELRRPVREPGLRRPVLEPGLRRPVREPGLRRPVREPGLRRMAEQLHRDKFVLVENSPAALSADEIHNLIHELQVHQIELELQNEELRQTQLDLEASRTRYFDIYDLAPVGYFILDEKGMIMEANLTAAKMVGISRSGMINYTFPIVILSADRVKFYLRWKELLETGTPQACELRIKRRDGSQFWALAQMSSGLDAQGLPAQAVVVSDINERKQAEEALLRSENRFRAIINVSPVPMALNDDRQNITFLNPSFTQTFGYTLEDIPTLAEWWVNAYPDPVYRQWVAETWQVQLEQAKQNRTAFSPMEINIRCKDGTNKVVISSATSITDLVEDVHLVVLYDITDRKQAESALQAAHAELEQRVMERTADLQASNTELEKALRAKNEFLAVMSHELRTPLSGILGLSQILLLRNSGELTLKQSEAIQQIENSGERLLEVINEILEFSQLQSGNFDLELEPCSLIDICKDSLKKVKSQTVQKKQLVNFTFQPPVIILNVDARRIRQIITHLLSNASKFTNEGGSLGLTVQGIPEGKRVLISVTDTGIGIKTNDLPLLFQPFTQLDMRLARLYNGTGLGLALVKNLAEKHGGSVKVESVVGQGSKFTICLPWAG